MLLNCIGAGSENDRALGIPLVADPDCLMKRIVSLRRILDDVRLERYARTFDEDHSTGAVVHGGITVVRFVQLAEVFRDPDGVDPGFDVHENARVPHAFFAFAVRPVMIEVAELPDERAFPDSGASDYRYAHLVE